jgi:uncharacterized protein
MEKKMDRSWAQPLAGLLRENRQIALLSGARQSGKTTLARQLLTEFNSKDNYLNWDDVNHRELILKGPDAIIKCLNLEQIFAEKPLLVFDELHKYKDWKNFLKGFFDRYENDFRFLVTGSARLDQYRKGGDSLMGRYFSYRLHPFTVRELAGEVDSGKLIQSPLKLDAEIMTSLWQFGGFPESFSRSDVRFFRRWQKLRQEQLFREDIRDSTHIQEIQQLQLLAALLTRYAGKETKYSTLARSIRVSVDSIRRWLAVLEAFYFCFRIRPWHKNIATALRKEPRTYLWDWSMIADEGQKAENFVACHLLKATHWWSDLGHGDFDLFYLRTKEGKEVDFLVTRDQVPWFLLEVKRSKNAPLNPNLKWFQQKTGAEFAFQIYFEGEKQQVDCFTVRQPVKVSAASILGQLV